MSLAHTNHEETIGSCCQPFFMFSIVESCNKAEDLSLAQRQPVVSRAYIIRARGLHFVKQWFMSQPVWRKAADTMTKLIIIMTTHAFINTQFVFSSVYDCSFVANECWTTVKNVGQGERSGVGGARDCVPTLSSRQSTDNKLLSIGTVYDPLRRRMIVSGAMLLWRHDTLRNPLGKLLCNVQCEVPTVQLTSVQSAWACSLYSLIRPTCHRETGWCESSFTDRIIG